MATMKFRMPKKFDSYAMRQALIEGLGKMADEIQERFDRTTSTWDHQPVWEKTIEVPERSGGVAKVSVLTSDKQYALVNAGARSHAIFPVKAPNLSFPGTFVPKSKVGVMKQGPGFSGPPQQARMWVAHPGFEGRKFDEAVRKSYEKQIGKRIDDIILKMVKASGWRMG